MRAQLTCLLCLPGGHPLPHYHPAGGPLAGARAMNSDSETKRMSQMNLYSLEIIWLQLENAEDSN